MELKPCPSCGETDTIGFTDCRELEECKNFECCDYESDGYVCVVCDANKGGCGASGGYAKTAKEAAEKWNRRAAPENNPLTLEQVKQLKPGTPIIIVCNDKMERVESFGVNFELNYWGDKDITDGTVRIYTR